MKLDLDTHNKGIMGLTQEYANFLFQACVVCLDNQNHKSGVEMKLVTMGGNKVINLCWSVNVDNQIKRNWNDLQEATEYAATAIAIKLAETESKSRCLERSSKGTGFDYWLGDEDDFGIFQQKERLEISGILRETISNTLEKRLLAKVKQIKSSSIKRLYAHVCIVEFGVPKSKYMII